MALIPFLFGVPSDLALLLLLAMVAVGGGSTVFLNTSWNSWLRDIGYQERLTWIRCSHLYETA